jgi:DNA primase
MVMFMARVWQSCRVSIYTLGCILLLFTLMNGVNSTCFFQKKKKKERPTGGDAACFFQKKRKAIRGRTHVELAITDVLI